MSLELTRRLAVHENTSIDDELTLDYLQREKGRFRAFTNKDVEVNVFLQRGRTLAIGEILQSACGQNIAIAGALEEVAIAQTDDWEKFSRACYHLGNRHVKVEIGDRRLCLKPDHVLEDLLVLIGLKLSHEKSVFVPESGAYAHVHEHQ
ncbi:MAG: urease accessory protein UreE [Pseudomonadales bacterium]|nr:urease accessory protein UreE [Pseudomonadales bacterium]